MKTILQIVLDHFQLLLFGLFSVLCCAGAGKFEWALISGVVTFLITLFIVVVSWKYYTHQHDTRKNDFKKWTKK